jgi:hypothetical protein
VCNPVLALTVAAGAVQAAGQWQSGLYASRVATNQAIVAKQNKQLEHEAGNDAIVQGQADQRRLGREVASQVGSQAARMGANNTDITFGSAARTIEDTQMIGREDQATLSENIRRQVLGHQISAYNFETERRAAKAEARQAKVGAAFGVASTILGSATSYAKFKASAGAGG